MNDILQIAAVGMLSGNQRLETISRNAASASLPGYRRQVLDGQAFAALIAEPESTNSVAPVDRRSLSKLDLRTGEMIATSRALDVAIDGDDAFFALTDGEQTWLTRAGALHLDGAGTLVGERGLRVVGAAGDIRLPTEDVQIEADGRITHEGQVIAALQLFAPANPRSLRAAHGTLLQASDIQPIEASTARIRSGMLEASNTDSAREMLSLMTLSRQFEGLAQLMQGYDAALSRAIEKLGQER